MIKIEGRRFSNREHEEAGLSRFRIGVEGLLLNEGYMDCPGKKMRKMRMLNKHLLPDDTPVEGLFQLPVVLPYRGPLPETFIPYSEKVGRDSRRKGVYCHIDDYRFSSVWTRPLAALGKVRRYMVAVAPDNTLWADGRLCENLEQVRRSRTIQRFWQNNGMPTIQTAAWGDAESVRGFAFDGLARHSWTAIGHQRVGNRSEQRLYRYAVMHLVERKHPMGLIVFGAPLDFNPGVPVVNMPSFISKLRRI